MSGRYASQGRLSNTFGRKLRHQQSRGNRISLNQKLLESELARSGKPYRIFIRSGCSAQPRPIWEIRRAGKYSSFVRPYKASTSCKHAGVDYTVLSPMRSDRNDPWSSKTSAHARMSRVARMARPVTLSPGASEAPWTSATDKKASVSLSVQPWFVNLASSSCESIFVTNSPAFCSSGAIDSFTQSFNRKRLHSVLLCVRVAVNDVPPIAGGDLNETLVVPTPDHLSSSNGPQGEDASPIMRPAAPWQARAGSRSPGRHCCCWTVPALGTAPAEAALRSAQSTESRRGALPLASGAATARPTR